MRVRPPGQGSGPGALSPVPNRRMISAWGGEAAGCEGRSIGGSVFNHVWVYTVSRSLTEGSVHSDPKIQTNCSTLRQSLTNELVRNWWKEEYAPFTVIPEGEAGSCEETSRRTSTSMAFPLWV